MLVRAFQGSENSLIEQAKDKLLDPDYAVNIRSAFLVIFLNCLMPASSFAIKRGPGALVYGAWLLWLISSASRGSPWRPPGTCSTGGREDTSRGCGNMAAPKY